MSLLLGIKKNESKEIEKKKEENGNPTNKFEKDVLEEKEEDTSNLTNLKVFNGLIEEDNVFKNLNKNNNENKNIKNSKKNLEEYFENKMIDLNYISFGDCNNIFVNNINDKKNNDDKKNKKTHQSKDKKEKDKEKDKDKDRGKDKSHSKNKSKKSKHSHSKKHNSKNNSNNNLKNIKIPKKSVEELLAHDSNRRHQTMSFNEPKELSEEDNDVGIFGNKNSVKEIIERKEKECKNFFKISAIRQGEALVVSGDDAVFSFPAHLLPKGAKLGESFTLEIKLFENNYNKKAIEEIEKIQKKYAFENDNNK
jgi:hypothetical protein